MSVAPLETVPDHASPPRSPLTTSFWPRDESVDLIDHTVGSLLAERARTHSDVIAIIGTRHATGEHTRLTYAELFRQARSVAGALESIAEPGDFVALWAPNVIEWPIIQYGAALAGVILVALNPVLRAPELEYALKHSGAKVLIHADRSRAYEMAPVAEQVRSACPALQTVISLSERDRWSTAGAGSDGGRADTDGFTGGDPDAPVMLQYTSGTTGAPKGVLLSHRSLVNDAKITLESAAIQPGSVAVNPLPMFHTAGCVISTLGPLWLGGTVVLIEQFAPDVVLACIHDEQASVLFFVPAVLGALLEAQRSSTRPAPQMRTIIGGASNVPPTMIEGAERVFGASVINLFGQTELSPVLSATRPDDSRADQLFTVGRPVAQVDCAILDPLTGDVQPLGVPGEICARGFQQMIEYLHDPAATAAAVDEQGFLHTGDLGAMDERGYITLTGRLKDLIIRGGENIAPAEIETCLSSHPAVVEASVFPLPDEKMGEIIGAAVRLRGEQEPGLLDSLVQHVRAHLSPHKIPARWFVAEEFPTTPTGKVQKFKLGPLLGTSTMRPLN